MSGFESFEPSFRKPGLKRKENGLKVVGTPIGTPEFIAKHGERIVVDEAQLLQSLPMLASLQAAWLLLYFCAVPRINHLLRTIPPIFIQKGI